MIKDIFTNTRYFYWFIAIYFMSLLCVGYIAEYSFGITPCPLCYDQRYIMMSITALSLIIVLFNINARIFTLFVAMITFGGALFSMFHIGVEQKWWAMPQSCLGNVNLTATDPMAMLKSLQEQMQTQKIVRCDQINWYLFGIPASWLTFLAFFSATIIMMWREWGFQKK